MEKMLSRSRDEPDVWAFVVSIMGTVAIYTSVGLAFKRSLAGSFEITMLSASISSSLSSSHSIYNLMSKPTRPPPFCLLVLREIIIL